MLISHHPASAECLQLGEGMLLCGFDLDKALSFCAGKHKLNLHASYAIFEDGEFADRDALEPKHFKKWVDFAKAHGMGIDFNPGCRLPGASA